MFREKQQLFDLFMNHERLITNDLKHV